ncbi:MAG: zinc-binding alcohol dehydrogenase [Acidobacteriota bacterium]|nr:zinc-binding alcohol dehydrogenase [Acidobacteriota bacterium]
MPDVRDHSAQPTIARQFWVQAPGRGAIVETRLSPRHPHEVLVETLFTGVSRGTEALVFRGQVPPSQVAVMRAPFQEGEFPGPVKYGYSNVGVVADGPAALVGRIVFCLFPHQDHYTVPAEAVTLVPEQVPPERAVLAANLETAVNVVWDAKPLVGDRIIVIGGGVVGILCAWLCHAIPGTVVTLIDLNPARASVADTLGLSFKTESPTDGSADLVIHASGAGSGLVSALSAVGVEGTIVEASWYGTKSVSLPLGEAFHSRRLTVRSSQVGRLDPSRAARWTHARRLALALRLLGDARLDALITGESRFEELPAVMPRLSDALGDTLCHRIRYGSSYV